MKTAHQAISRSSWDRITSDQPRRSALIAAHSPPRDFATKEQIRFAKDIVMREASRDFAHAEDAFGLAVRPAARLARADLSRWRSRTRWDPARRFPAIRATGTGVTWSPILRAGSIGVRPGDLVRRLRADIFRPTWTRTLPWCRRCSRLWIAVGNARRHASRQRTPRTASKTQSRLCEAVSKIIVRRALRNGAALEEIEQSFVKSEIAFERRTDRQRTSPRIQAFDLPGLSADEREQLGLDFRETASDYAQSGNR